MQKKDGFSSRLGNRYAVIHATAGLLNEAFGYPLSADAITERIIRCEQETFEERDIPQKALEVIIDYITQKQSHFDVETRLESARIYNDTYATGEFYGIIFKYDTHWNVHLLKTQTDIALSNANIPNPKSIRKMWVKRKITEGDGDHNTKQKSYKGFRARYDCFTIPGGITSPTSEMPTPQITPTIPQDTPVSTYTVDDTDQIEQIFGGNDGN